MDIAQFNQKLSSFIRDAKLLEKTDPKKARILWLKIAQYALEFSKKSGIDRDFKISLWRQIDAIIKKVKAEEIASGREIDEDETDLNKVASSNTRMGVDDQENIDFSSLPSVPTDGDEEVNVPKSKSPKQEGKPDLNIQSNKAKSPSFFQQIQDMENELKKMPDMFKEVPAVPFDPSKTIIKSTKDDPKQEDSEAINIQKMGKDIFGDSPIDLGTDNIDPYKGTKDFDDIKDPFGPAGIDQSIRDLEVVPNAGVGSQEKFIFCGKCGFKLPPTAKKCSNCGDMI